MPRLLAAALTDRTNPGQTVPLDWR